MHPQEPAPGQERGQVTVDYVQMSTAQKLLLFWRKPARKCWWDGVDVDVAGLGEPPHYVKLWARRVWTLELSLVRQRHRLGTLFNVLTTLSARYDHPSPHTTLVDCTLYLLSVFPPRFH